MCLSQFCYAIYTAVFMQYISFKNLAPSKTLGSTWASSSVDSFTDYPRSKYLYCDIYC